MQGYIHHIDHTFISFASEFAALGFACLGVNQPGMGSPGVPGLCENWQGYIDNAAFAAKQLAQRAGAQWSVTGAPSIPLFVYGQSMGGAVAIQLTTQMPAAFTGVLLSAPMCGIAPDRVPNACGIGVLKCLEACCPQAQLVPQDDIIADCFRCKTQLAQRQAYNASSGMPAQPRLRTGLQLYNATLAIQDSAESFAPPGVLLVQGTNDVVTDKDMTKQYIQACGAQHKTYIEYEGSWHVIEADCMDTRQALLHDVTYWLAAWVQAWEAANPRLVKCNLEHQNEGSEDTGAEKGPELTADIASAEDVSAEAGNSSEADDIQVWSRPQPQAGFTITQPQTIEADSSVQFDLRNGVRWLHRDTGKGPVPKHDEDGKPIPGSDQLNEN